MEWGGERVEWGWGKGFEGVRNECSEGIEAAI